MNANKVFIILIFIMLLSACAPMHEYDSVECFHPTEETFEHIECSGFVDVDKNGYTTYLTLNWFTIEIHETFDYSSTCTLNDEPVECITRVTDSDDFTQVIWLNDEGLVLFIKGVH